MRASIIIAAHNEGQSLWKTIRSCIESIGKLDCQIVIADDASDDESVQEALRRFPHLSVHGHEQREGASPTKHLGASNASGEVLVFLDGHCNPEPGAIERLVEDIERLDGQSIVTPTILALDAARWKNKESQVGHGYRLELDTFDCGWLPLASLRKVRRAGRQFYESPAAIGCAFAVHRELYDDLRGFDPHMRIWGVEDLDFSLKCWLMGHSILHDPEARIGHRFRHKFDNYDVPVECILVNKLRMAYKNFTQAVWSEWLERCRHEFPGPLSEHPEGLWACAWKLFDSDRTSAEQERAYLHARRQCDEFSYAQRFNLPWPRLISEHRRPMAYEAMAAGSPSPPPCTESDEGNWYNGYWKRINDLVGADAEIETRIPKLDCEPSGTWWDSSSVWNGVTLESDKIDTWAQVGYVTRRDEGSTVKWTKIYAESRVGSVYDFQVDKAPGPGIHRYTCNMIDPADGKWYFYYDSVGFHRFQHKNWKNKMLNRFDMNAETHHRKTHCAGTKANKCTYDDCRYRKDGSPFTSVELVAADSNTDQPEGGAFDQKLGAGDPVDNFEIWDTRA